MSKIRITSNPYEKMISYSRWDRLNQQWFPINYDSNPNSLLISDDLTTNFFPFKANKIVDVLIDEFSDGNLEIEFAGTEDEFMILKGICESDDYNDTVQVTRSAATLENAHEILPDIISIYNEIRPIVDSNISKKERIESEIDKFTDATNDQVPICVVGNYSAGKSSFINALIGNEILPSGDEPVTARVFKISPSHEEDKGFVKFKYDEHDVVIMFDGYHQHVESDLKDHPLIDKIRELIDPLDTENLCRSVNQVLSTINNFEEDELDLNISNLIEIEVPFNSTMFDGSDIDYVIFDTPGSNTATNYKHVEVLQQAMQNMSNGLPVFVAEYNTLDSMDNEKLYKDIDSLEELDSRFTMVVVNKADKANLPMGGLSDEEVDKILNMSIPRNLYSGGIFFVSSVIGLGAKTDGAFDNEFYEEVFDDVSPRFSNPDHKRYKCLYKYNIMPTQLKKLTSREAEAYEDLLLSNSGLYSVEQEIRRFAEIYSAYNKSIQADLFLGKILDMTFEDINVAKTKRVKDRITLNSMLEKNKASIVEEIEKKKEEIADKMTMDYSSFLKSEVRSMDNFYTMESMKEEENRLQKKHQKEVNIDSFWADKKASVDEVFNSISINPNSPKKSIIQLKDSIKKWAQESSKLSNAERAVQINAANELFQYMKDKMKSSNEEVHNRLINQSESYWKERAESIRKEMVDMVTNSEGIDTSLEEELEKLIITYKSFNTHRPNIATLDKSNFESKIMAIIFSDPLNLNRGKLIKTYNSEIDTMQTTHFNNIYVSYVDKFKEWINDLTKLLVESILEINPDLAAQIDLINKETKLIDELENTRLKLEEYANQIHKKISWQEE